MKICFYIESLAAAFTSGTPYRGLLRELTKLRADDEFVLTVLGGGAGNLAVELAESMASENVTLNVAGGNRKLYTLATVARLPLRPRVACGADVYFTSDLDYLGPLDAPQVAHIADLSSVRQPHRSTMNAVGRRMRRAQLATLAAKATHLTTISEFTKRDLIDWDQRFAGRVTVSHNGIDDVWFEPPAEGANEVVARLGAPARYLVWWGFASERKNLKGLIRAYAMAASGGRVDFPDLVLAGGGSELDAVLQLAEQLHVRQRVHCVPWPDARDLAALVTTSCGLVFPSFYEGFGLPAVEAMARGRAVVAADIPAMREVSGGHAILVDPEQPESIRQGIEQLLDAPADCGQRRRWAAQFTHRANAQRYSDLIDRLT